MSKQRQPLELIELKGKSHMTNAQKEKRREEEIKADDDNICAPKYLTKNQRNIFDEIANKLKKIGIISNLDSDCLARYISSEEMYRKITKKIRTMNPIDDILELKPLVEVQDKYFKQCRSCASDLGLTITSRCKIVVPKAEESKAENKFEKFEAI